jgi:prefoldin subunit 5
LGKYGIPVDDISKLAKLVNSLKQYEYNVENVINEFSNLEGLRLEHQYLQETVPSLESKRAELKRECSTLQTWISIHNQVLSKYHDLEVMGFGLNQLQFLWTTVREIARENNKPVEEAVTKFLSDVERQYNSKVGFESNVESSRNELNKLNQEQARLRTELLLLPLVGPKLVKLTQSGVTEQDIIDIAAVFEKYVAAKDRQSFISDLEQYGGLKSSIQELAKQSDKLRTEVSLLQTQNRDLNADNQRIISSLVHSEHTLDFMQGLVNSLRNEILGLASISAYIICSIVLQFKYLEKLRSNTGNEFTSVSKAYKGEESVSTQQIKKELVRDTDILSELFIPIWF